MTNDRYSRQTFLGDHAQQALEACAIAVVGLGGGGSHVVQQLAHLGVRHMHLFDADKAELSNLNRLVSASLSDVSAATPKVEISRRMIERIDPAADVTLHECIWQNAADGIKTCDVIISCVDSFVARQDLEATARRYMIPIVDIGMDVFLSAHCRLAGLGVVAHRPGPRCA
jgi:molybdopterin/thiamine biosynthesis adenylyltransferase